jgi:hypothetical protein
MNNRNVREGLLCSASIGRFGLTGFVQTDDTFWSFLAYAVP